MTSYSTRSAGKLFGARSAPGREPVEFATMEAAARLVARNRVGKREPTAEVVRREAVGLPWRRVDDAEWMAVLAEREPAL